MDVTQFIVLAVFAGTICALIFTNQRPSTVFSGAVLALLVTQQLSLDDILLNLTNKGPRRLARCWRTPCARPRAR